MFLVKSSSAGLRRPICTSANWLSNRNVLRHQSTAVSGQRNAPANGKDVGRTWAEGRPFGEIPKGSTWRMVRDTMPGGKYRNADATELMLGWKKDYGDIFFVKGFLGNPDMVVTHNPADFETVFRNEGVWPNRPGSELMHYYRSVVRKDFFNGVEGLITTNGKQWGDFRSAVNPVLMQPKNVRLYMHKMSKVNREFIDRIIEIRDPQTLEMPDNFEEEINRWTLESVSVVALDQQLGLIKRNRENPRAKILFDSLTEMFILSYDLEFKPSAWRYLPLPKVKRFVKACDNILEVSAGYVNEALERLEQQGVSESEAEQSVLEKLAKIDKKIATVMAMDMLMAGVDTTTGTFASVLLSLAKNPKKQQILREEITKLLPTKDSEFTEKSFSTMPYLRACIKEALRLNPLTIGNGRVVENDVVLSGYQVPKGSAVMMMMAGVIHDEQYFPQPLEFIPERWLRNDAHNKANGQCPHQALKSSNPFVFLPFGFGSRMCVGRRIAEMELELGIARIIRNFEVEFNHPTENLFRMALINMPNAPLKFKFTDVAS